MPERLVGVRRRGFTDHIGGTSGRIRNQPELRQQRRIFAVPEQQPVGIALNNRQYVIQLVGDDRGHVPRRVILVDRFTATIATAFEC